MKKQIIIPKDMFPSSTPYSPAVLMGNILFISGQVAYDSERNLVGPGDIRKQTEQCLKNLKLVLDEARFRVDQVAKVTIFLSDMKDFSEMNGVYRTFFGSDFPGRSCVGAKLALPELLVEIEAIAVKD